MSFRQVLSTVHRYFWPQIITPPDTDFLRWTRMGMPLKTAYFGGLVEGLARKRHKETILLGMLLVVLILVVLVQCL